MTKFNYIYFKKDKKLRILNSKFNSKLTVVFLHGLKADMEGIKPLFLYRAVMDFNVGFFAFFRAFIPHSIIISFLFQVLFQFLLALLL